MSTDVSRSAARDDIAASKPGPFEPPLSVTRPELLERGSDTNFRKIIWDLLVVANRLQKYPEAFGHHIGITGAQYAVLIATAHIQGGCGSGIRRLADHLHLPAPHVTTTVGALVQSGFLAKRPNPEDGRGVLVSLTEKGQIALERLAPFQQQVNDVLFSDLSRAEFAEFARFIDTFVGNTKRALDTVAALNETDGSPRQAAE